MSEERLRRLAFDVTDERSLWPHFAMDVLLNGFNIRGNRDQILALQEFKLDSKVIFVRILV